MANRVKKSLTTAFELPMDVMLQLPIVHMTGGALVEVENHKGLWEYSDRRIRIGSGAGPLTILGDHMLIESIYSERIVIRGNITGVHFGPEGE